MSENETDLQQVEQEQPLQATETINWQASEYVHNEKDAMWYVIFVLATAVVMALLYLLLDGDILSIVVVGLMAVSLIVFANRPPRQLDYEVSDVGVQIGPNKYNYDSFRSFSVVPDGAIQSIVLDPLQRFMPPITIYFPPEDGEKIVDMLARFLPHRDYEPNFIDRFARKVRF